MADQEIAHSVRVDQPRDFYIAGELVTAQPGNYLVTDAAGNLKILDHSTFQETYADANNGTAGAVVAVKPNTRKLNKNAEGQELSLEAPAAEDAPPAPKETPADEAGTLPATAKTARARNPRPDADQSVAATENSKTDDSKGDQ